MIDEISKLDCIDCTSLPAIYLLWLPEGRSDDDAQRSSEAFESLASFCSRLRSDSVVSILTTPPDAARLLPRLQRSLKFQLWIAVKRSPNACETKQGFLPKRHAALLVLSRYSGSLRHTKTRIRYTYCPACGKTTKDYGGKKHVYHEYGTLISDVWRDIECNPQEDISSVADRLADLFGLEPYRTLNILDMRCCLELACPVKPSPASLKTKKSDLQNNEIPSKSLLINGDCMQVLRALPDSSADFCFADPPYNLKKKYDSCSDSQEIVDYFKWCDLWLAELVRVLKPGRTLAVVNIPLWTARYYQFLSTILDFQCWIVWEALGFPARMIMPSHYSILCFSKGVPRPLPGLSAPMIQDQEDLSPLAEEFCLRASCVSQRRRGKVNDREEISDLWHDIHRLKHNSRRVDHPCQLPPRLMRRLFAIFTRPGEMILDCFNGAGTSTLVAEQMRRRFLGIEISPEYHEIALMRHEMLARGEDPFGKCDVVPRAKNSPVERLPRQKYMVTKKALQLEIKRITGLIGHIPAREEAAALSRYPMEYFDSYFLSWGEACAAARTTGMSERPP